MRATKFAKLEEGERRGTLRKEAVGLGRDASPSSDVYFPSGQIFLKFNSCGWRHPRTVVAHRHRIMASWVDERNANTARPSGTLTSQVRRSASVWRAPFEAGYLLAITALVNGSLRGEFGYRARPREIPKRRCGSGTDRIEVDGRAGRCEKKKSILFSIKSGES